MSSTHQARLLPHQPAHDARQTIRPPGLARVVVATLGGRYSSGLGIDVDSGDREVERWFLAATLFGTRIVAKAVAGTVTALDGAGLRRVGQVRHMPWEDLIALLDMEGYPRHDFRTGIRLLHLADALDTYYGGRAAVIGWRFADYPRLRRALDVLPGWGPLTTALFLREMRGVWPAAQPPLDLRAAAAARHLHLTSAGHGQPDLDFLTRLAADSELDVREVESALIRLAQAHPQRMERCPGGPACTIVTARVRHQQAS